jgi:hypothetical protein
VRVEPLGHEREPAGGLEVLGAGGEDPVELVDAGAQHGVGQRRAVDRGADQVLARCDSRRRSPS